MTVDKKKFWEDKILGWEDLRYNKKKTNFNLFEKTVDKTNNTLIYRLKFAFEILSPLIKNKKIVELGCGSGFLAQKFIENGASSYSGYDISEKAISRGIELSKGNNSEKIKFFAKPILEMEKIDADYVFSLGLTDWLTDEEIDHMLKISSTSEILHSISEKRFSISRKLHQLYVYFSYGRKTGGYSPRYLNSREISEKIKHYTNKDTYYFRNKKLSFGMFVSTFPLKNLNTDEQK
tara:strand:- start:41 stop:745 length:705 start_codon:yes stop_codon:yes gene_type:complete